MIEATNNVSPTIWAQKESDAWTPSVQSYEAVSWSLFHRKDDRKRCQRPVMPEMERRKLPGGTDGDSHPWGWLPKRCPNTSMVSKKTTNAWGSMARKPALNSDLVYHIIRTPGFFPQTVVGHRFSAGDGWFLVR